MVARYVYVLSDGIPLLYPLHGRYMIHIAFLLLVCVISGLWIVVASGCEGIQILASIFPKVINTYVVPVAKVANGFLKMILSSYIHGSPLDFIMHGTIVQRVLLILDSIANNINTIPTRPDCVNLFFIKEGETNLFCGNDIATICGDAEVNSAACLPTIICVSVLIIFYTGGYQTMREASRVAHAYYVDRKVLIDRLGNKMQHTLAKAWPDST